MCYVCVCLCKEERPNMFLYVCRKKKEHLRTCRKKLKIERERKMRRKKRWLIWASSGYSRTGNVRTPAFIIIEIKNLPLKFFGA